MQLPTLARCADRTYTLLLPHNVGALRTHLEALGYRHFSPKTGDLYTHRWRAPDSKTTISMFASGRIVCIGASHVLDELVECSATVEPMPDGGSFLAFEGEGGVR